MAKGPAGDYAAVDAGAALPSWRRFAHAAMHTRFEVIIAGHEPQYAEQAAAAAFELLDRLEQQFSRFIPSSDVAQINALQPGQAARVGDAALECLQLAARVWAGTHGAFDVTTGALMEYWRRPVSAAEGDEARLAWENAKARTGMQWLEVDGEQFVVRMKGGPVSVDLGAIGKGYAVDRMVDLLREWDVRAGVVSGGGSTVFGIGAPEGRDDGWPLTLVNPGRPADCLRRITLRDRALSCSAIVEERHIIEPRTGRPAEGRLAAWSLAPAAALADALSTAFLILPPEEIEAYCREHPKCAALWTVPSAEGLNVRGCNWL
jgi:thiamine biosynthesis lipoprotein